MSIKGREALEVRGLELSAWVNPSPNPKAHWIALVHVCLLCLLLPHLFAAPFFMGVVWDHRRAVYSLRMLYEDRRLDSAV